MANALSAVRERPKVLVIDDNPDLLQLFCDVLGEECDYAVTAHGQLPPTVEQIRLIAPDVMIVDHRLAEGVQGWDLILSVRRDDGLRHLPILFCTADLRQLEHIAADMTLLHVIPLVKPFSVDQLVNDVAQALNVRGIDSTPCP